MRKCVDSETPGGQGCAGRQPGGIAPDLIFKVVRRAYEKGETLVVAPYPISASFFRNIGFRVVEKGPEMALDHEELKNVLSEMDGMIGGEKDLSAWDIFYDYLAELGQKGPILVWPTDQLNASVKAAEAEEGASGA